MHFSKAIASAVAFLAMSTLVKASLIPSPARCLRDRGGRQARSRLQRLELQALGQASSSRPPRTRSVRQRLGQLVAHPAPPGSQGLLLISQRFALSYGQLNHVPVIYGLDKMENSAQQLSDFIDKVLNATGADNVDILVKTLDGHSQGSIMPRYYFKFLGGATKVHKFAAIGSIQYGSTLLGLVPILTGLGLYDPIKKVIDVACLSCFQFLLDSPFICNLNAGGDTVPGIEYLMITSKLEETVTPYTSGFLRDKNSLVHNTVIQDWCPLDIDEHVLQAFDPVVFTAIDNFFSNAKFKAPTCLDYLS
ncbi:hypothetical protein BG000_004833 [Podila horticola]|nr:hypothetical protein BG000_004833 [Podila horticola]